MVMPARRKSSSRELFIWMNGERVGVWQATPHGDVLQYDAAWLSSAQKRPLSLSLPFTPDNRAHKGPLVRAYFDNLLPDSQAILARLARRFQTASTDAPDLLAELGRDCVGAIQLTHEDALPNFGHTLQADVLSEADIARLLRTTHNASSTGTSDISDDFRISIAGAQEKTALLWHNEQWWCPQGATPTTHILKLPMGLAGNTQLGLHDSVDNEWLCAQIVHAYGLPVARCHPLVFEDQRVLAVERFDRRFAADGQWIIRLPQEDFCQATGTPPHLKYEADGGPGMARIFNLLQGSSKWQQDRETFFRAQLLFWLLRAPDGHAKNFSIALQAGGGYTLTPLYDVMSAYPMLGKGRHQLPPQRVKLAMAMRSKNTHWRMQEILPRHWLALGQRQGIVTANGQGAEAIMADMAAKTSQVIATVQAQLPPGFPSRVAEPILVGLETAVSKLMNL